MALENAQGLSLREALKDTWRVETVNAKTLAVPSHQDEAYTCSFVPAKPHGPENSEAEDLPVSRSDLWSGKIGKS